MRPHKGEECWVQKSKNSSDFLGRPTAWRQAGWRTFSRKAWVLPDHRVPVSGGGWCHGRPWTCGQVDWVKVLTPATSDVTLRESFRRGGLMKETCTCVKQVARRIILGDREAAPGWSLSAQKEPLWRRRRLGRVSFNVASGVVVREHPE